jgi:hypothetical protein
VKGKKIALAVKEIFTTQTVVKPQRKLHDRYWVLIMKLPFFPPSTLFVKKRVGSSTAWLSSCNWSRLGGVLFPTVLDYVNATAPTFF